MRPRTAWPWISLLVIAIAVFNPVGLDLLDTALFAGEQLARSIAQFIVMVYLGGLCGLALVEFMIRILLIRRAQRRAAIAANSE